VTCGDSKLKLPTSRCQAQPAAGDKLLVGVRPEKVGIVHTEDAAAIPASRNRITGRILASSFIGVSTQFIVDSPSCADFEVYVQNVERDVRLTPGAEVVLHWNLEHTFGLDADQAIDAGVQSVEDAS
jgi:spermidine/putrescine transport system ATP-binding protein